MKSIRTRRLAGLLPVLVICSNSFLSAAEDGSAATKKSAEATASSEDSSLDALLLESLDDELLESLDDELLEGLDISVGLEAGAAADPDIDVPDDLPSDLDAQLLEQLGEGEDLGRESSNPLESIGKRMRVVEELISRRITSGKTQRVQGQIVADLEQLIEQLKQQCKSGQCNSNKDGPSKPDAKPGSSKRGGSGENRSDNRPAKESADRTEIADTDSAELERMKQMLKHVWGHLPAKVREQMQSGTIEEFLPKYEKLIEEYYSRLAREEM